ncbi:SemiSWEET transporter [Vibrio salinus]|uniref:SemiSWEET transporter n=1 Tax=Vibrio salinus TaxID=2899784 RepID=UPI001E384AAC|nr:SemiSWEET transporter [Vibrio salinus]MCE0495210.1 SemiSWEET transporter [Vibrio salinus]
MHLTGYFAAVLTTISFLPQIIHTIKSKDTKSISLSMYTLFLMGSICWLIYGIDIHSIPVITANIITVTLSGIIFMIKLKHTLKNTE